MHPVDEEYRIQQQDRQYEERQRHYRPGWDDNLALLEHLAKVKAMTWRWEKHPVNASLRDADEQADELKSTTEYAMKTWGWTVEQYNQWVKDENRKRREHWTQMDFNEKIKRGLV